MLILTFLASLLSGICASMGLGGGSILILFLTLFLNVDRIVAGGVNLMFFIPVALVSVFMSIKNKSYKLPLKTDVKSNSVRQLSTVVAGVPCVYGYGGLHGSKDNEIFEGILLAADVALWLMGQLKFFELYQRCVVYG